MSSKHKKRKPKYNLEKIKYTQEDKKLILDFVNGYKSEDILPPKNFYVRRKNAVKFVNTFGSAVEQMLASVGKNFGAGFILNIKALFYKYYNIKKLYPNLTYDTEAEKKLDRLMDMAAVFEAAKLMKEKASLKNPACADLRPFLKHPGAYSMFFNSDIRAVINISEYAYSLEQIDSALSRRFDLESKRQVKRRMFYIHVGKTNSGKTYSSIQLMKKAEKGAYLSPLRLLALEISDRLNSEGVPCSFVTGEEERRVENAKHIASTVELADFGEEYDVAVIDECQMIADNSRGYAWTRAIMGIRAAEVCLCTAPEALDVLIKLVDACGDFYEVINHRRKTPLAIEDKPFNMEDVQPGDALVVFSKQKVNAIGAQLIKMGIDVSVLYGALPYETRKQQFENFINGRSTVLVTTDAIGMGVNLPVRRVIFMEVYKFDGIRSRLLTSGEIKQIAGRAGRRGKFDVGYVSAHGEKELKYIAKNLNTRTQKVGGICVGFPKQVLDDEYVGLKNAITAWNYYAVPDIYIKENLQEALVNISLIRHIYQRLGIEENKVEIFEFATMPVDARNQSVRRLWCDYMEQRLSGHSTLRKPYLKDRSVDELLTYSKMLDTYFMCGRIWEMEIDIPWLNAERKKCTESIIEGLIDDVGSYTRHCSRCGRLLDWNNTGFYCEECAATFGDKYD